MAYKFHPRVWKPVRYLAILTFVGSWPFAGFQSAPASPIEPDEGRPHVGWKDADKVVGRVAFVSGKVEEVHASGRVNFLDFDASSREGFVGIVYRDNLGNFPGSLEELYKGKIIRIRGMVSTHQGQPQIQVKAPSQIEILDEMPPTRLTTTMEVKVGDVVTIATYNVLNLFDDIDDPYFLDETTPAKPRAQMEKLAQTLRTLNADVIGLQEVENRHYLERFLEVFVPDLGYRHVVHFEGNDTRGIDVALISRIPVGVVRSYRHHEFPGPDGKPMVFERDILAVELRPPQGVPFEVWVLHLKSNFEGREYAEPIRKAEATEVRRLLDQRLKSDAGARIIVLGDFNDTPENSALQTIRGAGPNALKSFFEELSEGQRVTYNKEPFRSMIDFILASPAMAVGYAEGSYRVIDGTIESSGSDHNPVSAKFKLR
jgi:endonuclease/exonuclease/phosphatase family metal-dependent hydrolase